MGSAAVEGKRIRIAERIVRTAEAPALFIDSHPLSCIAAVLLVCGFYFLRVAVRLPMWNDELFTLITAGQATVGETIAAMRAGADGMPPAYALMVRPLLTIFPPELATRFPTSVGYCFMLGAIYSMVRRRVPGSFAMISVLVLLAYGQYYATEGRSYGLVLGASAAALASWQAAADGRRRGLSITGLVLGLGLAMCLHYYAVFLTAPLLLGEAIRWRNVGKLDRPVVVAILASPLVLVPHIPLALAQASLAPHFWARPSLNTALSIYSFAFEVGFALLFACLLGSAFGGRGLPEKGSPLRPHEWVAMSALAALPLLILAVTRFTTHVYAARYGLPAIIGVAVLGAAAVYRLGFRSRVAASFCLLALTFQVARAIPGQLGQTRMLRTAESARVLMARLPAGTEPVVVADEQVFLELSHYGAGTWRDRLLFPIDIAREVRYTGTDTMARSLQAIRYRAGLRIQDYEPFLRSHEQFLLVADGASWMSWDMQKAGFRVTPLERNGAIGLYRVRIDCAAGRAAAAHPACTGQNSLR